MLYIVVLLGERVILYTTHDERYAMQYYKEHKEQYGKDMILCSQACSFEARCG